MQRACCGKNVQHYISTWLHYGSAKATRGVYVINVDKTNICVFVG